MKARYLLIPALLMLSNPAAAAEMTLQNDGWIDGGTVYCQAGFAAGEEGAATLGPVAATFTIEKIRFLFCGDTLTRIVTLRIYLDSGNANPGTEIYSADYQVAGADDALQEIDLSGENVAVPGGGSFRVSFQFQHSGLPSISRDDDGITAGRNWINATGMGWMASDNFGLTGDWVIRAIVDVQQVDEPDAGTDAGGDPGGGDTDAGADLVPDEDTTSCNTSSDCQGGQVCENGLCVTVCTQDSDCQGGEVCNDQRCVEAGSNGDGCGCHGLYGPGSSQGGASNNGTFGLFLLGLLLLARRKNNR